MRICLSNVQWASLCLLFMSVCSSANVSQQQLDDARQCVNVASRLDRLSCFDKAFDVPLNKALSAQKVNRSISWQRAMDTAKSSSSDITFSVEGECKGSNAWIAIKATNEKLAEQDIKPVLLMSCIDNLSRVELALPESTQDARVRVTVANYTEQVWRSDDTGLVMSSARGIPAINWMKTISRQPFTVIRSNSTLVDGLLFDTGKLDRHLHLLRERCGW